MLKILSPLKWLFKGLEHPLYTLLEAVADMITASIEGRLAMNPEEIIDFAESAIDSAEMLIDSDPSCPLAKNELSAVIFYTMDFSVREQSPYFVMNAALRNEDRNQLKPFIKYLWLFMHAFKKVIHSSIYRLHFILFSSSCNIFDVYVYVFVSRKCPVFDRTVLYRGVKGAHIRADDFTPGKKIVWAAVSSLSDDISSQETFLGYEQAVCFRTMIESLISCFLS